MFCRLWKIQQVFPTITFSGINRHCSNESCIHTKKIDVKLSCEDLGWICSEVIYLDNNKNPEKLRDYQYCLNFMHPVQDDIWIFINPEEDPFKFNIMSGPKTISNSGIGQLNERLKQIFGYDGDWLTEEFILKWQK